MILDADLQFSNAQSVTATAVSTNVLDFSAIRNVGVGQPIYVVLNLAAAMVGAGAIITVTAETDDNESFSSATVSATLGVFAAVSPAGTKITAAVNPDTANERFYRLRYTVSGGTLSSSQVDAYLSLAYESTQSYADAVTIS
jgi:hypothetical protein